MRIAALDAVRRDQRNIVGTVVVGADNGPAVGSKCERERIAGLGIGVGPCLAPEQPTILTGDLHRVVELADTRRIDGSLAARMEAVLAEDHRLARADPGAG